jgi:hypothetical protein
MEAVSDNPPTEPNEIFNFLNEYWDKDNGYGLEKIHLVYFKRKCQAEMITDHFRSI